MRFQSVMSAFDPKRTSGSQAASIRPTATRSASAVAISQRNRHLLSLFHGRCETNLLPTFGSMPSVGTIMRKVAKLLLMACALLLVLLGDILTGSAADIPQSSPALNIPIQRYGQRHKLCLAWSDGCVTCSREGGCSNIGIACQPKEITCTQHQKAPEN